MMAKNIIFVALNARRNLRETEVNSPTDRILLASYNLQLLILKNQKLIMVLYFCQDS